MRKLLLAVSTAALFACTSSDFNDSVQGFGVLSATATNVFEKRLAAFDKHRFERELDQIAENRIRLHPSPGCDQLVLGVDVTESCQLTDDSGTAVDLGASKDQLVRLSSALGQYSANLVVLAASPDDDVSEFQKALQGFSSAVVDLDVQLALVAGRTKEPNAKIGATTDILSQIGSLFLEAQRADALRRIVHEADPNIQIAAGLLTDAMEVLLDAERGQATLPFERAIGALEEAVGSGANKATIKAKQRAVFTERAKMVAVFNQKNPAAQIGPAHSRLVELSSDPGNLADFNAALGKIADATASVRISLNEFK